jgi:hypothetical protein
MDTKVKIVNYIGWLSLNYIGWLSLVILVILRVTLHLRMKDPYDWHKAFSVKICGLNVPDTWGILLKEYKKLKDFNVYANWSECCYFVCGGKK